MVKFRADATRFCNVSWGATALAPTAPAPTLPLSTPLGGLLAAIGAGGCRGIGVDVAPTTHRSGAAALPGIGARNPDRCRIDVGAAPGAERRPPGSGSQVGAPAPHLGEAPAPSARDALGAMSLPAPSKRRDVAPTERAHCCQLGGESRETRRAFFHTLMGPLQRAMVAQYGAHHVPRASARAARPTSRCGALAKLTELSSEGAPQTKNPTRLRLSFTRRLASRTAACLNPTFLSRAMHNARGEEALPCRCAVQRIDASEDEPSKHAGTVRLHVDPVARRQAAASSTRASPVRIAQTCTSKVGSST